MVMKVYHQRERVAEVDDAVIDIGASSRPGKGPRDDTAAFDKDAWSGQAR